MSRLPQWCSDLKLDARNKVMGLSGVQGECGPPDCKWWGRVGLGNWVWDYFKFIYIYIKIYSYIFCLPSVLRKHWINCLVLLFSLPQNWKHPPPPPTSHLAWWPV